MGHQQHIVTFVALCLSVLSVEAHIHWSSSWQVYNTVIRVSKI